MFLAFLFSLSISILAFVILYGLIKNYIVPKTTIRQRLHSINTMNTVDASRIMVSSMGSDGQNALQKKKSLYQRIIQPWLSQLEKNFYSFTPNSLAGIIEHRLVLAGQHGTITVGAFSTVCFMFMVGGILIAYSYVHHSNLLIIQVIMYLLLGALMGLMFPFVMLNMKIKNRQKKMLRQLPEFLDLMCVSVQAGLTFDAATRKIVQRMHGPLIDEFHRTMDDMRMGVPRKLAMKNMANRCDLPELTLFLTSIIQANRLGTSISKTLAIQADNMRDRRRQAIKALAMKAPVKMLFPLVFFIFPALFVVVLLPTVLTLIKNF